MFDPAAVLIVFEQLGGTDRALEAACAYAQQRFAFGRAIGALQAIKHGLADRHASTMLARSNACAVPPEPARIGRRTSRYEL